jgi:hypothetical protein
MVDHLPLSMSDYSTRNQGCRAGSETGASVLSALEPSGIESKGRTAT